MQHVRLMTWCSSCVSGMHLPFFAASATGLFAQRGLEVEFVACPTNLTTAEAVAGGHADFALTSVAYLLAAQTAAAGRLPVRFIATAHQRNPIVAVVRQDSDLSRPADLPGARTARWSMPGYAQEYAGALDYMGLGAPAMVDTPGDLDPAMGSGDIDVIPVWIDDTTRARLRGMTLHHDGADFGIRAIPLDIPIYSTGLVAADRLPSEVTCQMRDALVAGYEHQRQEPEPGLDAFGRHFPGVSEEHARVNWALFEPYAFDGVSPGNMDAERWEKTIAHTAKTHRVSTFAGEQLYRPELLAPAPEHGGVEPRAIGSVR
jgi:hypothetical protein